MGCGNEDGVDAAGGEQGLGGGEAAELGKFQEVGRDRVAGGDDFAPGHVSGEQAHGVDLPHAAEADDTESDFFHEKGRGRGAEEGNCRRTFRKDAGAASRLFGNFIERAGGVWLRAGRGFGVTQKKRLLTSAAWGLFALPCSGCSVAW